MWPHNAETVKKRFHCAQLSILGDSFKSRRGLNTTNQQLLPVIMATWRLHHNSVTMGTIYCYFYYDVTADWHRRGDNFFTKGTRNLIRYYIIALGFGIEQLRASSSSENLEKISNLSPLDSTKRQQQQQYKTKRISCSIGGMIRCCVRSW